MVYAEVPAPAASVAVISTALFSTLLLFWFLCWKRSPWCGKELPPSPPRLPFVGNAHQLLGSLAHHTLRALSREYGPLMLLKLGQVPTLVVSSAEMAEEVMKAQDLAFASRSHNRAATAIVPGGRTISFAPYGEYWRQGKKICVVHLLSAHRVQTFRCARMEEVERLVAKISDLSSSNAGAAVDMSNALSLFTNSVICWAALGKSVVEEAAQRELTDIIAQTLSVIGGFRVETYFPSLAWLGKLTGLDARLAVLAKRWRAVLDTVMGEAAGRRAGKAEDVAAGGFLDVLLALREDADSAVRMVLSDDGIKSLLLTMIAAATDTSFLVLDEALEVLVKNPAAMEKAQEEVRATVQGKPMAEDDDVSQMSYLKAVLKETLRLYPPLPLLIPRESARAVRLGGYRIPEKTRVVVNVWAIGRDPAYWESPEEFRPERFLGSDVDFRGNDFRFIPFGAGRRNCPGINFAMANIELALANLLYRFDWSLPEEAGADHSSDEGVVDLGLTARKRRRLLLVAKPRS